MSSEVLALVSSFCFASAFVTGKRGLAGTSLVATVILTMGCAWVVLVALTVFVDPPAHASSEGIVWFIVTGLVAPGIGYSAALAGVHRLGPATSVPIQQGGRPLISSAAAVVLLGESMSSLELVGIVAIIAGGLGLSMREAEVLDTAEGMPHTVARRSGFDALHPGIVFPVMAALTFAAFDIMVKHGLGIMGDPTFAAMVAVGSGFWGWVLLTLVVPKVRREFSYGKNVEWVVGGGVLFAFAQMTIFHALLRGRVVLVGPLLASQPLIVLVLSKVLLREIETIRPITVFFTVLVVSGTTLIAL